MRITRIYHPKPLSCGETTQLDTEPSNHLIKVLRSAIGSPVVLFNGDGFDYQCKTLDRNVKKTLIAIESKLTVNNESNLSITLIQGLSRTDRMETTIQKSVELGVNKIIPLLCQRSNTKLAHDKRQKKIAYWNKVAISACEQSGRGTVPVISEIKTLQDIEYEMDTNALKLTLNPNAQASLKELIYQQQKIEIFIGPEGGLNKEEIQLLNAYEFTDISFGPRILRTETAGPAVISALQVLWGDC